MLILFEGPDGAGKTTVCREVQRRLASVRFARGYREPRTYESVVRSGTPLVGYPHSLVTHAIYSALAHVDFSRYDLLVDRLWVSDIVYGTVVRREPYDWSYVRPARDFKYVFVAHLTADMSTLYERRPPPSDPRWDFSPAIRDGYVKYFAGSGDHACAHETFLTDRSSPQDVAARVVMAALNAEHVTRTGGQSR